MKSGRLAAAAARVYGKCVTCVVHLDDNKLSDDLKNNLLRFENREIYLQIVVWLIFSPSLIFWYLILYYLSHSFTQIIDSFKNG